MDLTKNSLQRLICHKPKQTNIYIYIYIRRAYDKFPEFFRIDTFIDSKVWTIGRVKNCLDAHLGLIVCDKDGVVDWCIALVEMPQTRFEEC